MVAAYKVDEGIMKNIPGKQCDYGLYTLPSGVMRFIELKGSDCGRAIKQLIASIDHIIDKSVEKNEMIFLNHFFRLNLFLFDRLLKI